MKKITKTLALLLCFVLVAGIMSGCSKKTEKTSSEDGTLSYWCVMDGSSSTSLYSYDEMLFFQELEKRTGVKVDFIHPVIGSKGGEAFVAMLTSQVLPDVVEYTWSLYQGGPQAALDDGVIIALDDYLEEYAPNYYDYMEGEKGKANNYRYKYETTSTEGNYYGFNRLKIGNARLFDTFYIRADLLKKWGMDIPETIDDWTAVFAKAKSEGIEIPFSATPRLVSNSYTSITFQNAFGVSSSFYVNDNGKVVFAPFEKGYKEFVAQMAEWVKLGYIGRGFITNDGETITGNMVHGRSIATVGGIGGSIGKILPAGRSINPEFDLVACPYPVAKKGDVPAYLGIVAEATDKANAITKDCENVEQAMRWCDYVYSEEGFVLQTFGVEGDTYTIEERDGEKHYVYTDKILKPELSGVENITQALYKYMLPANHPGLDQHPDYLDGFYTDQRQKDALALINADLEQAKAHKLPALQFTDEEAQIKTDIEMEEFDALEVAIADIVLGKASIDTFDAAVEKAKAGGYDEVLEIYQAAYERYINKINK